MTSVAYVQTPSTFGDLSIVWRKTVEGPRVQRILLPNKQPSAQDIFRVEFSDVGLPSVIVDFAEKMRRFLAGEAVEFEQRYLDLLALETCSEFQRRVLLAEYRIPRGWVSAYGRIAKHIGCPGGARAVGNALAGNPFPIIIPCHRTIRANGRLGKYGGGVEVKRQLLEIEGVQVDEAGYVLTDRFYY